VYVVLLSESMCLRCVLLFVLESLTKVKMLVRVREQRVEAKGLMVMFHAPPRAIYQHRLKALDRTEPTPA
jgi:hypothetical protein